jgi:hypothetical protein
MSGRKAKAARKAEREPGETYMKEPIRNPGRYLTRDEREIRRRAEVQIERRMRKLAARVTAAVNKRGDQ